MHLAHKRQMNWPLCSETGAQTLFGALSLGKIDCSNVIDFPRFPGNAALVNAWRCPASPRSLADQRAEGACWRATARHS